MVSLWLGAIEHPNWLLNELMETNLCARFPDAALTFLSAIVPEDARWFGGALRTCLLALRSAKLELVTDSRFARLALNLRISGVELDPE